MGLFALSGAGGASVRAGATCAVAIYFFRPVDWSRAKSELRDNESAIALPVRWAEKKDELIALMYCVSNRKDKR